MSSSARGARVLPVPLRRRLAALLIVAAAVLAPVAPGAAAPAATEPAGPPVLVTVTQVTPQVLQPGQDLTVTATLRNTGTLTLAEPQVLVHLDRRSFMTRTSLDRWREAEPEAPAGSVVATVPLAAPLAPGASAEVVATVPAASVGLRSTATLWGARGLAVEVVDRADPARARQGIARTFALWFPEQEVSPTQVTVLVPVVGPAADVGSSGWVTRLEQETAPGGRLAELLRGTARHTDVTWVLDPSLVELPPATSGTAAGTSEKTGGTPAPSPTPGATPGPDATEAPAPAVPAVPAQTVLGPNAAAWATSLLDATTGRDVRLLPYGDTDVMALAHAGADDLLARASARAESVASAASLPGTVSTLTWPAMALPDLTSASFLARAGEKALVLGPRSLPVPEDLIYTPTGRTTITTAGGDVTALLPDERLSTALTTGLVDNAEDEDPESEDQGRQDAPGTDWRVLALAQLSPATAGQDLLAELAVVTRERPSDTRHVLLTVPRDWQPDGDVVDAQLAALAGAPWVRPETVSALIGAPDPDVDRGSLPARAAEPEEIRLTEVTALRSTVAERAELATMVPDADALTGDLERELLAPLSVAWREDPAGRTAAVQTSQARTQAVRDAVTVVPPRPGLNLISTTGDLPLRLRNALQQPVTVTVSLRPESPRLRADERVTVTVPALGEVGAVIPVHAIQSADLDVVVEVRTLDGALVDEDTVLPVRVRAEWEGIGTAIIAAVLALGLVIGLIRTIRRGRSSRRSAPVDAGPDALSPEVVGDLDTSADETSYRERTALVPPKVET